MGKMLKWKGHEPFYGGDKGLGTSVCAKPGDVLRVSDEFAESVADNANWEVQDAEDAEPKAKKGKKAE